MRRLMYILQYAQCIEITTDQDTEETWEDISSPEIQSYSHHFPLTPPDEITVCGKIIWLRFLPI